MIFLSRGAQESFEKNEGRLPIFSLQKQNCKQPEVQKRHIFLLMGAQTILNYHLSTDYFFGHLLTKVMN